jgi:hypothetical protein
MSSWGCETGNWYTNDCSTANGSTFNLPITLNIYSVNSNDSPGTLLATLTKNFDIPFRPSASAMCTGSNAGKWFEAATSTCYNGLAHNIEFNFPGITLPVNNKVIISVAYNTTNYGYAPWGTGTSCYITTSGCGYDSLNVGLYSPPTVGSLPLPPNNVYMYAIDNTNDGYCDGGPNQIFRLTTTPTNQSPGVNCWANLQPAFRVTASD